MSEPTGTTPVRVIGRWSELSDDERAQVLDRGRSAIFDPALRSSIVDLIEDVREHGDDALVRALSRFDHCEVAAADLRISDEEISKAHDAVSPELDAALDDLIDHLRRYNERLLDDTDWSLEIEPGMVVGERSTPISSVGLFVPSGKGSFPSVLAQLGVPAVVAGVPRIAVVVPPVPGGSGEVDPAVLVVADKLGIRDVFRANGPSGVAALAMGTESVPKVVKIMGPGSPAVTCAQVEVQRYGTHTQMLLGASESLVLADATADPAQIAADILNEAEHGMDSTSLLVTSSAELAEAVQPAVAAQLAALPEQRRAFAQSALGVNGGVILTSGLEESCEVANAFAPEHMKAVVAGADEDELLRLVVNAGELLLGPTTTVSMANFVIGCPAALPTSGYAHVTSGVTVEAFRKKTAIAKASQGALERCAPTVIAFARHEGFPAHEASVAIHLPENQ